MSSGAENLLGAVIALTFLTVVIGGPLYLMHKLLPGIVRKRRKREIETAMRFGMADGQLIDEVADELRRDREDYA